MNTLDCKDILYMKLIENDYYNLKPNQKKILVNEELKKYLVNKINNYYKINSICERYEIEELINYLNNKNSIVPVILFVINIMSEIQQYKISWIIYPDKLNTEIIFKDNLIDKIKSNEKYSNVFNYIYNYYLNEFDKEDNKSLKKQD